MAHRVFQIGAGRPPSLFLASLACPSSLPFPRRLGGSSLFRRPQLGVGLRWPKAGPRDRGLEDVFSGPGTGPETIARARPRHVGACARPWAQQPGARAPSGAGGRQPRGAGQPGCGSDAAAGCRRAGGRACSAGASSMPGGVGWAPAGAGGARRTIRDLRLGGDAGDGGACGGVAVGPRACSSPGARGCLHDVLRRRHVRRGRADLP